MNQSWKERLRERWQRTMADRKSRILLRRLGICLIDAVAFIVINALHIPGIVGTVLRMTCVVIMVVILIRTLYKKED